MTQWTDHGLQVPQVRPPIEPGLQALWNRWLEDTDQIWHRDTFDASDMPRLTMWRHAAWGAYMALRTDHAFTVYALIRDAERDYWMLKPR